MVVQLETHARSLVERALDHDNVIYLGLQGFEDHVELPSSSGALVDDKLGGGLEGAQGLEAHMEDEGVFLADEALVLLLEED